MSASLGQPQTYKRKASACAKKEEDSPEKKRLKAANNSKNAGCRKLKALADKAETELNRRKGDLPALEAKGYPSQMVEFMRSKLVVFETEVTEAKTLHAGEVVAKTETDIGETQHVEMASECLETAHKKLDANFTAFKKGVVADLLQLTGKKGPTAVA